jgi:Tfp pilus assembly protein PilF
LWESTGDFTKAMESYTKALESEASHAPALTSIARLHFRQGKHKQAAEFFQRAITQSPDDAGLHNDLGLTLNKLGDSAGATKSLEKALELAPGTSRYANNLASVKFEAGDSNGAYEVLASNNKPAVAHFNMAYLYFKGGKVDAAREHLGQVMKYETQAAADPAIQRAVERSRDMIAQISAATAPVAQAAPQASIAAGNQVNPEKTIQQTSQSTTPTTGVSPAASILPANLGYQIPGPASTQPSAPKSTSAGAVQPPATSSPTPETPSASVSPTRPMPTRPTMESEADQDAMPPSNPFSLPDGFGTK